MIFELTLAAANLNWTTQHVLVASMALEATPQRSRDLNLGINSPSLKYILMK
jgi:hypothetical protein